MKNVILFLLLLSVGFNIGLGYKLLRQEGGSGPERNDDRAGSHQSGRGTGYGTGRGGDGSTFWKEMMDQRLTRLAERLDLSPEQAETFRARHEAAAPLVMDQRLKVHAARTRLRDLIEAGAVDPDSVRAAITAVNRQQSVMDSLVTETVLEEMELLDDSQRALYLEILPVGRGLSAGQGHRERKNHRSH